MHGIAGSASPIVDVSGRARHGYLTCVRARDRTSRFLAILASLLGIASWGNIALAQQTYCAGTVQSVLMYSDGGVMIFPQFRGDWIYLCNIFGTWKGIPDLVCVNWHALAVKAKANALSIGVYYVGLSAACNDLETYSSSPAPHYVRLDDAP